MVDIPKSPTLLRGAHIHTMTTALARIRAILDSLKVKLTLGSVAALAVGMGIVAFLLVRQTEHDTLASQRLRQMSETVRVSRVLSHRVIELQRSLQVTAAQLDPATMSDPRLLADFIKSKPVLNAMFSSVFVSSASGEMLMLDQVNILSKPGIGISDRRYIAQTLQEGRPIVSEPLVSRVSGEPIIVFTYPLRRDGAVFGVLAGSLRLTSRDLVADLVEDDGSGSLLAVADLSGTILAHPQSDKVLTSVAAQPRLNEAFTAWRSGGSAAEPSGLSLPQSQEMVSVSGVPGTDWVVWRTVSQRELLAPLSAAREHALHLVCGLLGVMSVVMILMLTWLLRPLVLLKERAQHLFDGRLHPQEGWPKARGELAELTRVLRHVGTERAKLEDYNNEVLKKLGSVMSSAPIGIAFTRDQRFELVSAELCRLLGRSEGDLLGQPVEMVYADRADYLKTLSDMELAFQDGHPYVGERQLLRADCTAFCAQLRGRPVDVNHAGAGVIWTVSDVTEQVASRTLLEWSATHDMLTGLANRTVLEERLERIFQRRPQSMPAAIVVIDLDHFKPINDNAGHAAGDAMLRAVAEAISARVRGNDLVVRTGGDEFALLLEGCPAPTALRIAGDVRQAIIDIALQRNGKVLRVGASLGVAMLRAETVSVQAWFDEADAVCYEVKRTGRGAVRTTETSTVTLIAG